MSNVLGFLGNLVTRKVEFNDGGDYSNSPQGVEADVMNGATAVTSRRVNEFGLERHAVLIDLDVPAWLVPSSTEGNSHLYIDVSTTRSKYFRLLDALAECGVIERGYAEASKRKGASYLRLPWVKKSKPVFPF